MCNAKGYSVNTLYEMPPEVSYFDVFPERITVLSTTMQSRAGLETRRYCVIVLASDLPTWAYYNVRSHIRLSQQSGMGTLLNGMCSGTRCQDTAGDFITVNN